MQSKLIVGNWKLNPLTLAEAQALALKIDVVSKHKVVLCPSTPFLPVITYPTLGAQDVSAQIKGAYTGQVSAAQLKSLSNLEFCIVGHSERRALSYETDELVNQKVLSLLQYKIKPIICVGFGTTVEEDELEVMDTIKHQVEAALVGVSTEQISQVVVAYEPMWAIGSKTPATPDHADQVALFIKTKFPGAKVLYGGSVNSTNSQGFLSQIHLDGLLIGGASLLADDFNKIIA
jgi:triosephosphate isomerase (TIM)